MNKKTRLRLQTKIILLSTVMILIVTIILGVYSSMVITTTIETKIGENALSIAKAIALMPRIHEAFNDDDPAAIIQPIAERIREEVGAEFIVIGNKEGIRYSHPYPDRLGKKMVGGDNDGALEAGSAYISKAIGTLGPSLRGKAPIFNNDGEIIGVVSVGFLIEDIKEREFAHIVKIGLLVLLLLLIGIVGSYLLALNIKKDIFGLEPEEISQLFLQREILLESVKEGIIAVDQIGRITVINDAAKKMLLKNNNQLFKCEGKPINEVLENTKILDVLKSGNAQYDQEMLIGNEWVITNRIPMTVDDNVVGAVASFRRKTEIDHLLQELSDHKIYLDTVRAQNHEFTNKLYTISGMLQLGKHEEAIQFIAEEASQQDDIVEFLMERISDSKLSAFLIGKMTRAEEQKVRLEINQETKLLEQLPMIDMDDLITIYGNLIENSLDSVRNHLNKLDKQIEILLVMKGNNLVFRIEDWGVGISDSIKDRIFKDGFTTKPGGKHQGLGLALVYSIVEKYQGKIEVSNSNNHKGTIIIVTIPIPTVKEGNYV